MNWALYLLLTGFPLAAVMSSSPCVGLSCEDAPAELLFVSLPSLLALETKVSGAGWADPHSKKEMFNVRTLSPFFLEKESRVPSPLLVFHPEFAQKKAGARHGHPGFRQDPCRWSSLALPLPPGLRSASAFLGMGPVSPWSRQPSTYHQKEATRRPQQLLFDSWAP